MSTPDRADHDCLNMTFHTNVQLIQKQVEDLDSDIGEFDRIFCISAVVEHAGVDGQKSMIRAMNRLLLPRGLYMLTMDLFLVRRWCRCLTGRGGGLRRCRGGGLGRYRGGGLGRYRGGGLGRYRGG